VIGYFVNTFADTQIEISNWHDQPTWLINKLTNSKPSHINHIVHT